MTYVINESLLDDVETDEVEDSTQDGVVYIFKAGIGSQCPSDFVKNIFIKMLESFVSNNEIREYSLNINEHNSWYEFCIYVTFFENDIVVFNTVLAYIIAVYERYKKACNVNSMTVLSFKDGEERNKSRIHFCKSNGTVAFIGKLYEECSDMPYVFENMHSFVPVAVKLGVLKPFDENHSRFGVYDSVVSMMFVFDQTGKSIFSNTVYMSESDKELRYDETGHMRMNVSEDDVKLVDMDGKECVKCSKKLKYIGQFNEGIAVVALGNGSNAKNYIDIDGNLLSKDWFEDVSDFKNGYGLATINNYVRQYDMVLLNSTGKNICKEKYDYIEICDDIDYVLVGKNDVGYNFIDKHGNYIWDGEWFECVTMQSNGYAVVLKNNKETFIHVDENGISFLDNKWHDEVCGFPYDGSYAYLDENEWNILDIASGKPMYDEGFDTCETLDSEKMYMVKRTSEKFGDNYNCAFSNGKLVCDKWFFSINIIQDFIMCYEGPGRKVTVYNKDGKLLVDDDRYAYSEIMGDYVIVKKEFYNKDLYNVVDRNGKLLSKNDWFTIISREHGHFLRVVDSNNKRNVLSSTGKLLLPRNFDNYIENVQDIDSGEYCIVVSDSYKYALIDKNGNWSFGGFIDDTITETSVPGILRVGLKGFADYKGNSVSFI